MTPTWELPPKLKPTVNSMRLGTPHRPVQHYPAYPSALAVARLYLGSQEAFTCWHLPRTAVAAQVLVLHTSPTVNDTVKCFYPRVFSPPSGNSLLEDLRPKMELSIFFAAPEKKKKTSSRSAYICLLSKRQSRSFFKKALEIPVLLSSQFSIRK